MKKNKSYNRISSFKELQSEIQKIDFEKERCLDKLSNDVKQIKGILSFDFAFNFIHQKIEEVKGVFESIHHTVSFIISLFKKKNKEAINVENKQEQKVLPEAKIQTKAKSKTNKTPTDKITNKTI